MTHEKKVKIATDANSALEAVIERLSPDVVRQLTSELGSIRLAIASLADRPADAEWAHHEAKKANETKGK
jgi:hypothetical protein